MAVLKIYNDIVDEEEKVFLQEWCGVDGVCFKSIRDFLDNMDETDNQIQIKLHCAGGDCIEGWAIYDALRQSGKEISATVEGECASMATIILLAAPKERRFATRNARICIHNPFIPYLEIYKPEPMTADKMADLSARVTALESSLRDEQKRILDLYVERTGSNAEELQSLMNEDKFIDMDKAVELGFIGEILTPNTASRKHSRTNNTSKMAKTTKTTPVANSIITKLLSMAGLAKIEDVKVESKDYTAADGAEFTVEREDGNPQVGDTAYPDGSYVMEDGTTIVVENEVITSIAEGQQNKTNEELDALKSENAELKAKVEALESDINAQKEANTALAAEIEDNKAKFEAEKATAKEEKDAIVAEKDALVADKANLEAEVASMKEAQATAEAEKEALVAEKDAAVEAKATAEAEVATVKAQVEDLNGQIEALKSEGKTEDEKAIIEIVNKAGGKEWIEKIANRYSKFAPKSNKFQSQAQANVEGETKTQKAIREAKERNAKKRQTV